MITKICTKCKIELPLSEFNSDKSNKDGLHSSCRNCCIEYKHNNRKMLLVAQRKRRELQKEKLKPKVKAWNAVYFASHRCVKNKVSKPELCEVCGVKDKIQGHHNDYGDTLKVIWVCQKCHCKLKHK